jgi:hypothetical protein
MEQKKINVIFTDVEKDNLYHLDNCETNFLPRKGEFVNLGGITYEVINTTYKVDVGENDGIWIHVKQIESQKYYLEQTGQYGPIIKKVYEECIPTILREKQMLENKVELLEEDLECIHMFLDKLGIPRTNVLSEIKTDKKYVKETEIYSIVGRVKQLKKLDEKYLQEIIPYCSEHFINFPLFEEGDYRPVLSIWQIPKGNTPSECCISYNNIKSLCFDFFSNLESNFICEIVDHLLFEERLLPCNMKDSFVIKIHPSGYVLDKGVKHNYSIIELLKVGSELLSYIKDNVNKITEDED